MHILQECSMLKHIDPNAVSYQKYSTSEYTEHSQFGNLYDSYFRNQRAMYVQPEVPSSQQEPVTLANVFFGGQTPTSASQPQSNADEAEHLFRSRRKEYRWDPPQERYPQNPRGGYRPDPWSHCPDPIEPDYRRPRKGRDIRPMPKPDPMLGPVPPTPPVDPKPKPDPVVNPNPNPMPDPPPPPPPNPDPMPDPPPPPPDPTPPPVTQGGNLVDVNNNGVIDDADLRGSTPRSSTEIGKEIANDPSRVKVIGEQHFNAPKDIADAAVKESRRLGRNATVLIELPKEQFGDMISRFSSGAITEDQFRNEFMALSPNFISPNDPFRNQAYFLGLANRVIDAKRAGATKIVAIDSSRAQNRDAAMADPAIQEFRDTANSNPPTDIYLLVGAFHSRKQGQGTGIDDSNSDLADPLVERLETALGDANVLSVAAFSPTTQIGSDLPIGVYEKRYVYDNNNGFLGRYGALGGSSNTVRTPQNVDPLEVYGPASDPRYEIKRGGDTPMVFTKKAIAVVPQAPVSSPVLAPVLMSRLSLSPQTEMVSNNEPEFLSMIPILGGGKNPPKR
jgi:hypothetical protein